jgi:cardiolipin synthase
LSSHLVAVIGFLVPFAHAVGIFTALHAVLNVRTAQGAIAWALSLLTFPYLAVPLYWVFGRNRFFGYVEALRRHKQNRADEIDAVIATLREHRTRLSAPLVERFGMLERFAWTPFTGQNEIALLVDGRETFDAIFKAIEEARSYILLEFFIVHDDGLGRELKERLLRKRAEGVNVYFLYDEIGSHSLPPAYANELNAAGAVMQPFLTTRGIRNRFQINFRNHRKIVIVDGCVAFVGGHNVGDEYLGLNPKLGRWRDTHLRVEGPAVAAIQLAFSADWSWACDTSPENLRWASEGPHDGDIPVLVLPTGPSDPESHCSMFLVSMINAARRRAWIASPYFVPDAPLLQALKLAALRGVDVRVILPQKPDHLLVYLAAFSFLPEVQRCGVRTFRFADGFMHQKAIMIDDDAAAVGTVNLDNRSLHLNFELTVLGLGGRFAGDVARMLERDLAASREVYSGEFLDRGLLFRLAVRCARLLEPIL